MYTHVEGYYLDFLLIQERYAMWTEKKIYNKFKVRI